MKEGLELLPDNGDCFFSLMLPFVLLSTEVDVVPKKRCCKGNAVGTLGPGNGKVILTLLTEVIAFHVGLITIDIR